MASGTGSNFEALVQATQHELDAEICCLVVNKPGCGAQLKAERHGIPSVVLDHRLYNRREDLDRALIRVFLAERVEVVVMAGWMRIVTPLLIHAFQGRLINLHPSLLPSFRGMNAVGQALEAGVSISGCTAHLVSEEVDAGAVICQAAIPVLASDTEATLSERLHTQEHRMYPWAVALLGQRIRNAQG